MSNKKSVTVFGMGYIGLPTAAVIASRGIRVNGIDTQQKIVETISRGDVHIVEPDLHGLVKSVVSNGYLTAMHEAVSTDVYLIAVPTPFKEDHQPDLGYVNTVVESLVKILKEGDLIILESTSPVGTTEGIHNAIITLRPELAGKIYLAYCPERVLPGNIIHELVQNDRVVGGINPESSKKAKAFYRQFVQGDILTTTCRTAEMCKLVENSYRDVNIAFANELSMICKEAEIDVWELITLANRHPRVNVLSPGVGVGGHCIAVDPWFIISAYPKLAKNIREARLTNRAKSDWVIEDILANAAKIEETIGRPPVVACMGLSYKPDIDDLRESPALYITKTLVEKGLNVLAVEPHCKEVDGLEIIGTEEALAQADLVAFMVGHQSFGDLTMHKPFLNYCNINFENA